jgi:hypothetical protein
VLLLHGSDDVIIPPTEMLWLQRDIPNKYLLDALISPAIGHVNFDAKVTLHDHLALVHWMALMIHEARSAGDGQDSMHLPAGLWLAFVGTAVH